ncbi:MAG TPA: hypothetical protein PKE21_02000 [Flavobacteriales bacterium]|nr:hypothetical protein [Flavobacteriales bacterium]HMR26227.1 hypothetical protein [Flavobacteriales bacterium]
MRVLPCAVALGLLAWSAGATAQDPLEGVLLERYAVRPDAGGGPELVTYRLYIDLPEGHRLNMVYGDEQNELLIRTSTHFVNSPNSVKYGDRMHHRDIREGEDGYDSWLSIGAASDRHWGVPRDLDTTDGTADGLVAMDSVPQVVNMYMEPGYLGSAPGCCIHTMNGAWAVLGGTAGLAGSGLVLIGQFTTQGQLTYALNAQVQRPDGSLVRCVSTVADEPDELLFPLLKGSAGQASSGRK